MAAPSYGGMNQKKHCQFWISYFQQLKEDGNFTGTYIDKELIRLCFLSVIQVWPEPAYSYSYFQCYPTFRPALHCPI